MQPSFFQGVVGGVRWKVRKAWFGGNFSSEEATTAERASACCKQITPVIERWKTHFGQVRPEQSGYVHAGVPSIRL